MATEKEIIKLIGKKLWDKLPDKDKELMKGVVGGLRVSPIKAKVIEEYLKGIRKEDFK